MFDTKTKRARTAQRMAEDTWNRLIAAAENAGDAAQTVQRRTHEMADGAGSSVASSVAEATDEARRRAAAALDALAGRHPRMRWEWIAGAMVAGLVVGWFAATGTRRAVTSGDQPRQAVDEDKLDKLAEPEY